MVQDFTVLFLGEMVVGTLVFTGLFAVTYSHVRKFHAAFRKLDERAQLVSKTFTEIHLKLLDVKKRASGKVGHHEMENGISLLGNHVLWRNRRQATEKSKKVQSVEKKRKRAK
jgi:hypothetical protein